MSNTVYRELCGAQHPTHASTCDKLYGHLGECRFYIPERDAVEFCSVVNPAEGRWFVITDTFVMYGGFPSKTAADTWAAERIHLGGWCVRQPLAPLPYHPDKEEP